MDASSIHPNLVKYEVQAVTSGESGRVEFEITLWVNARIAPWSNSIDSSTLDDVIASVSTQFSPTKFVKFRLVPV